MYMVKGQEKQQLVMARRTVSIILIKQVKDFETADFPTLTILGLLILIVSWFNQKILEQLFRMNYQY